ncbi:autophagy associated PX/BAR domain sorting nexin Atg20 [Schizosaccharomyces osmophilus]|uniref:Autophagy associated PX/BAR domain sorting nexin Atg20 n=1 Tax=Schizosaccharomyces osmophilus TaxID=2545709 RepID=A0AAE9WEW9_9SCHI|nr:autophagy associated PX/BAR domain sorting nexin Atg20 [Schizosaccharomyces osmophilus]WBW75015.1 autophagy associated PX/BAR domain sorting nexin Atg20 [Schizosaccharomyces osmophilus]
MDVLKEGGYKERPSLDSHETAEGLDRRTRLQISIVSTVTSSDGSFVEYEIAHKKRSVWRRYSDFESLVKLMHRRYPAAIVPPIPGKQSLLSYAKNPRKAKNDADFLGFRSRMLELFLRQCFLHPLLHVDIDFDKFINSSISWSAIISSMGLPKDSTDPLRLPPIGTEPDPFAHLRSSMPLVMSNAVTPPSSKSKKQNVPSQSARPTSNPSTTSSIDGPVYPDSEDEAKHPPTSSELLITHDSDDNTSSASVQEHSSYLPSAIDELSISSNPQDTTRPESKDLTTYTNEVMLCRKFLHHNLSPSIHSTLNGISKMESSLSKLGSAFHSLTALSEAHLANHLQVIANAFEFSGMYAKELEQEFNSAVYEKLIQSMQLARSAVRALKYKDLKIQQRDFLKDQLVHSSSINSIDSSSPSSQPFNRLNTIQRTMVSHAKKGYTIFGKLQNAIYDFVDGETSISKETLQEHRTTIENQLTAASWDCQTIDKLIDEELEFYKLCQSTQLQEIVNAVHASISKWAQSNLQRWLRTREELEELSRCI